MASLLETRGLTAFYGDFQAVFGIDIDLDAGETIAVIGANGAGKSTLMRSIAGVIANRADMVLHRGEAIGAMPSFDVVRRGIALVPEGRKLFASLTVEENLQVGSYGCKRSGPWSLQSVYTLFPILKERHSNPATALSGGQQQMVAIGRALMSNPGDLALRRAQPRSGARRHQGYLRSLQPHSRIRDGDRRRRAGYRPGPEGRRSRLLHDGGTDHPERAPGRT